MNEEEQASIFTESGVNLQGEAFCGIKWNNEYAQFTPDALRDLALVFLSAAEAAEQDSMLYRYLIEHTNLTNEQSASVLAELRVFRGTQGEQGQ